MIQKTQEKKQKQLEWKTKTKYCEFCDKNLTSKIRLRTHKASINENIGKLQKENNIKQEKDNIR